MLERFWHRHFAKKLSPTLWEKRLLAFATSDDNSEQTPENTEQQQPTENADNKDLLNITKDVRGDIEQIRPLVAKDIVQSPFILETGIDLVREAWRKGVRDPETETIITKGNLYLEEQKKGKDVSALTKELTVDIETLLRQPSFAVALCKAFERRMEHVHELKQQTSNVPLSKFIELEKRMSLDPQNEEKLHSMISEPSNWSEQEVNDAYAFLGIAPKRVVAQDPGTMDAEQKRTLKAVLQIHDINQSTPLSKKEKLSLLHEKIIAARKIAVLEKADIGSETTLENTAELEKQLFKQLLRARENLEEAITKRAQKLRDRAKQVASALAEKAGGSSIAAMAGYLGVSEDDFDHNILEMESVLQRSIREAKVKQGEQDMWDTKNLPVKSAAQFTAVAERLHHQLSELSWLESDNEEDWKKGLVGESLRQKNAGITWAKANARRLQNAQEALKNNPELKDALAEIVGTDKVRNIAENLGTYSEVASKLAEGKESETLRQVYDNLQTDKRDTLNKILLFVENPSFARILTSDKQSFENANVQNNEDERDKVYAELGDAIQKLTSHPLMSHETCVALNVANQITAIEKSVDAQLKLLPSMKTDKAHDVIRECKITVAKLSKAADQLQQIQNSGAGNTRIKSIPASRIQEYVDVAGTDNTAACYSRTDGYIYINESKIRNSEHREAEIKHEQGHAIVDILIHKTGVLPHLLVAVNEKLSRPIPGDAEGKIYLDVLKERAADWYLGGIKDERLLNELLMDELINKYASWLSSGKDDANFSKETLRLFALLEQEDRESSANLSTEDASHPVVLHSSTEDNNEDDDDAEGNAAINENSLLTSNILETQNKFLQVQEFIDTHQKTKGITEFTEWVQEWKEFFEDDIKKPFYNPRTNPPVPEEELEERMKQMETFTNEVNTQMKDVRIAEMNDTEEATASGSLMQRIRNIQLISIIDVGRTFMSMGEDLQRMWKRRSEKVQAALGRNLTSWIGDGIPYAGQLKHEFERRSHQSELEEIKQWKEALDDVDSYELMDTLGTVRNRDQVRAILELLTDRGRLDMNDQRFWKTLSDLSGMRMPIEACKDDSILRDKWLQKMITEIWGDKDMFFEWRQKNDSGIDSGKNKFTQVADQLSNIDGGLSSTLERQLRLYVEGKESGQPMSDEVNPHLYEKLVHYSMSNGKMSMEDKMFYLVQGARYGIISIDRVQALAGENGGVLNQFPMIDYFTGSNNTWPEMYAIGKRIEEKDNKFSPGAKTSFWIHTEVLRNEGARQRISKALSGARTEALDHEDIPTLAAMMDYKNVEEITGVLSGSRFKISYEAAKNFYTGTGKGLMIKALKAKLADENKVRFTTQDAAEAARTIVTHIHFDNILTGNADDGKARINMTLDQLSSQQGPSTGGLVVKEYRDPLHKLARQALEESGVQFGTGHLDGVENIDQYLRSPTENEDNEIIYDGTRKTENFKATGEVVKQLTDAFVRNPSLAQRILSQYADQLIAEGGVQFEPDQVENFINTTKNHEQYAKAN